MQGYTTLIIYSLPLLLIMRAACASLAFWHLLKFFFCHEHEPFFCHQCLDLLGMSKYCLAGGQQELVKLLAMSKFYNVFYMQKDF